MFAARVLPTTPSYSKAPFSFCNASLHVCAVEKGGEEWDKLGRDYNDERQRLGEQPTHATPRCIMHVPPSVKNPKIDVSSLIRLT